jgi:acetate kinase
VSRLVLALNAGSSSLKFALFRERAGEDVQAVLSGQVEDIGHAPHLVARDASGASVAEQRWPDGRSMSQEDFIGQALDLAESHGGAGLAAIGHRIVHGGAEFVAPAVVDRRVMEKLQALAPLAPLHQPHNLAGVRAAMKARPAVTQVACFDTAFHATQAQVATRLALTRELEDQGVRRYGFHGLSYEFIAGQLALIDPPMGAGRVIVAHLGSGASLCALARGRSVDTTMGLTPLDGLVMGTRCGALDPGVILYLLQALGWSAEKVQTLLYSQAGLLGVSGISSDMRQLEASDAPAAHEAIELFVWRLAREAGGLASSLGGVDGFVFTAGIGEHSARIRAQACVRLAWLGVELDEAANARGADVISTPASPVKVRIMATDEDRVIARHVLAVLGKTAQAPHAG